ncbi:hypothetical protein ABZ829_22195 [Streptomyces xanthochromogenes]|uniref:hypothetical protein n=1 Tax=Streptomyces xanthochromogenes TaxID=67384 RepID=UPI00341E40A6
MDPTIVLQEPIDQRAYWRERKSIHYPLIRALLQLTGRAASPLAHEEAVRISPT